MTAQASPDQDIAQEAQRLESVGIANALIKTRSELGMTQAQLSEQSGVSRSAIKAYETGRNMPGSRELKAICRVLKVSPNMLLFGTETPFQDEPSDTKQRAAPGLVADPEDAQKARARLVVLADMLSNDEVAALLKLTEALAIARHGADVVKERLGTATLYFAMALMMKRQVERFGEGGMSAMLSPEDSVKELEQIVDRLEGSSNKPQA